MSGAGKKASAKIAVGVVGVLRATNIGCGLRVAAQVLAGLWTSVRCRQSSQPAPRSTSGTFSFIRN
jgi:hypothetical protein